jgi:hypothetical protein
MPNIPIAKKYAGPRSKYIGRILVCNMGYFPSHHVLAVHYTLSLCSKFVLYGRQSRYTRCWEQGYFPRRVRTLVCHLYTR